MSDFYKQFLIQEPRRLGSGASRNVFLAAFGKHPGWDDHIEDIGLETESLIFAKSLLYVQGIGGQIDSGEWEKLDPGHRLDTFKHLLVWQRGGQFLLGRMWSSSDGKGRKRYPMVVCAHCLGVPLSTALEQVLPRLEAIERECLLTSSAGEVKAVLDQSREELRRLFQTVPEATAHPLGAESLSQLAAKSELGPDQEGLLRIVYQMQNQMSAFAPGRVTAKADPLRLRPQQIRVPAFAGPVTETIHFWTRFFQCQLDPATPLLFFLPIEEDWLDVTLGEPTLHELFCLRASPKKFPRASEIPYNLTPDFKEQARRNIEAFTKNGGEVQAQNGGPAEASTSFLKRLAGLTGWGGRRDKPGETEHRSRP